MKKFSRLIVAATILCFAVILSLHNKVAMAESSIGKKYEVQIDFVKSEDKASFYPKVTTNITDYENGQVTSDNDLFKEFQFNITSDDDRVESQMTYTIETKNGIKTYSVCRYGTMPKKYALLQYDLSSKKLSIIKEFISLGKYDLKVRLFVSFGAYVVYPDNMYPINYDDPQLYQVYSLETNELIAELTSEPHDYGNTNPEWGQFNPHQDPDTLIYQNYERNGSTIRTRYYELFHDGSSRELFKRTNLMNTKWDKTIGDTTFMKYYDKSYNQWFVAYSSPDQFILLNDVGTEAYGEFSPNNKYFIMKEIPTNFETGEITGDYYFTVIDVSSGKKLYNLSALSGSAGPGYTWYGDSIVKLNFNDNLSFFLNLETGILTKNTKLINSHPGQSVFIGDIHKLITLDQPYELLINGKSGSYTGQGSFWNERGTLYVPARDFLTLLGANMEYSDGKLRVNRNNNTVFINLSDPENYLIMDRSYLPLEKVEEALGLTSIIYDNKLIVFSNDLSESDLVHSYPHSTSDLTDRSAYESVNETLQKISGEYKTYSLYKDPTFKYARIYLTFRNSRLVCVEDAKFNSTTIKGMKLNGVTLDQVTDIYGPMSPVQINNNEQTLTYNYTNKFLVFSFKGKYLSSIFYIPK